MGKETIVGVGAFERELANEMNLLAHASKVDRRGTSRGHVDVKESIPVVVELLSDVAQLRPVELHTEDRRPNNELFEVGVVVEQSRNTPHLRSNASCERTSSMTSTRGGTPTSTGNSDSSRWANA